MAQLDYQEAVDFEAAIRAGSTPLAREALRYAWRELEGDSSGHDSFHVARVFLTAQRLSRAERASLERVELIAALHDVQDFKFTRDTSSGARAALTWLVEHGADAELAADVSRNIQGISFKGEGTPEEERGCYQLHTRSSPCRARWPQIAYPLPEENRSPGLAGSGPDRTCPRFAIGRISSQWSRQRSHLPTRGHPRRRRTL